MMRTTVNQKEMDQNSGTWVAQVVAFDCAYEYLSFLYGQDAVRGVVPIA